MRSFFKMLLASCLGTVIGLVLLFLIGGFLLVSAVTAFGSKEKPDVRSNSVLTIDLKQHFNERSVQNPLGVVTGEPSDVPGVYDVVRLIEHAKNDDKIEGIYLIANYNANSFASSEEIRNALLDFKSSKKFVLAHSSDIITQDAYFIASVADRVYLTKTGMFLWGGFNVDFLFIKGTLDKLKIEPQIFYAGKFKSATEPLRATQMTPENKLQTREWLGDLYDHFLVRTAQARKIDTATLHNLANTNPTQTPEDALSNKLIDGLKYDDEVKDEIKTRLNIDKYGKLNFISIGQYADAVNFKQGSGDRIALIYGEGNILDGPGNNESIGSDEFIKTIRRARLDKSIKAIVFRINSPGGSATASENIWRELSLVRQEGKPLVVSFGNVAASGGYYIATAADSIFANPNTITGSIGVFGIIPNMKGFFNDKLGITFDGVKTATYADAPSVYRPMDEAEKKLIQQNIDRIYLQFKERVAQGRKKEINYIDSIAQGRVWSGEDALRLGLVDRIGGLQDAVDCAARMANLQQYRLREYPEKQSWLNELLGKTTTQPTAAIKEQLGEEQFLIYKQMLEVKQMCSTPQARLPFQFFVR